MYKKRAITLVEVLVITLMIVTIIGIIWLAMAPAMKAKALETRIRSDLRQISMAVSMYMADNDDKLPRGIRALPKGTPKGLDGEENGGPLAQDYYGPRTYRLRYTQRDEEDTQRLGCKLKWEENKDGIAFAPFRTRRTGGVSQIAMYDSKTWEITHYQKQREFVVLTSFLDGHIAWVPEMQPWLVELMTRRAFIRR